MRHGCNAHRGVCCLLFARCVAAGLQPLFHEHIFQGSRWLESSFYKQSTLCVSFPFPWDCQVLVWHHCHHVLSSSSTRQSRHLPFFPHSCTFSMVMTIACCPCHVVRGDLHFSSWQSWRKIAKRWLLELSCYLATLCGFLQNAGALLYYLSCCLAHVLCARCFPSVRSDTASIRSCLFSHWDSLTRGRLSFAQEAVRGPPPFSLFGSSLFGCARWFQAASEKCLFKRC